MASAPVIAPISSRPAGGMGTSSRPCVIAVMLALEPPQGPVIERTMSAVRLEREGERDDAAGDREVDRVARHSHRRVAPASACCSSRSTICSISVSTVRMCACACAMSAFPAALSSLE